MTHSLSESPSRSVSRSTLHSMFRPRSHRAPRSRLESLRRVPAFAELTDAALAHLDAHMTEIDLPAGATLMTERQRGREALVIAEGVAEVSVDGRAVTSVSAGDLVGETALLDSGPRTATVTALTPLRIYVLDAHQFGALFDHPDTARWIATALARRVRALGEHVPAPAPAG
jgi:CRP/FNR family cyclic AMP-dependent transcriptional regulator